MKVSEFDFDLPDEAIALRPAVPRDHARLLQVGGDGCLSNHNVYELNELLRAGDLLVVNETRVFPSALSGIRAARPVGGGGDVNIGVNLHQNISANSWRAFIRPAKRIKIDDEISFQAGLKAKIIDKKDGGDIALEFNLSGADLMQAFHEIGVPPLPPYIARQRNIDDKDWDDYQTVYAAQTGSVAAPTAGLHFTPGLLENIKSKGIQIEKVLLHVGAGTFLPVKTDDTDDHIMHSEWFSISEDTARAINQAKENGRRIIAVGTTSLRALESAGQGGQVNAETRNTDIFITPGYQFKIVDGLMTNFHLPKSTLFMLVSAFTGAAEMKTAYQYAIENGYRFYSYGDSSLLWRKL